MPESLALSSELWVMGRMPGVVIYELPVVECHETWATTCEQKWHELCFVSIGYESWVLVGCEQLCREWFVVSSDQWVVSSELIRFAYNCITLNRIELNYIERKWTGLFWIGFDWIVLYGDPSQQYLVPVTHQFCEVRAKRIISQNMIKSGGKGTNPAQSLQLARSRRHYFFLLKFFPNIFKLDLRP